MKEEGGFAGGGAPELGSGGERGGRGGAVRPAGGSEQGLALLKRPPWWRGSRAWAQGHRQGHEAWEETRG